MFLSAKPISPCPVAPCWPRYRSASDASVQRGGRVTGVTGVVAVVVAGVLAVVVVAVAAVVVVTAAVVLEAVEELLLEAPHAVRLSAASTARHTVSDRIGPWLAIAGSDPARGGDHAGADLLGIARGREQVGIG